MIGNEIVEIEKSINEQINRVTDEIDSGNIDQTGGKSKKIGKKLLKYGKL